MLRFIHWSAAVFLLHLLPLCSAMGQDIHELKRPYFCSTCFTTTQDQNYHCCFYFFKCCAEARLGSRSTTPNPRYPGLPSGVTFFVQNKNAQPCSVDCKDTKVTPNLCCRMQSPSIPEARHPAESEEQVFKPAFNMQVMEQEGTDSSHQSSAEKDKTTEISEVQSEFTDENTSKSKYQNLGLDITGSPYRLNLKNINSERRLFHAPSLIFDHETEGDSIRGEDNWKKRGWYTKDILNQEIKHQE